MSLELKNRSGPGASDGLTRPSPRTTVSMAIRCLITINVDPSALRAIVQADLRQPTFKFFPKLPVEVQLMIWELAVGTGPMMMIVKLDSRIWSLSALKLRHICCTNEVNWTGAALLGVCRLSRGLATRVWGRNVCHIPVPGTYTDSMHVHDVAGCVIADLTTAAFYMPNEDWIFLPQSFAEGVRVSTVAFPYDPQRNSKCGNPKCDAIRINAITARASNLNEVDCMSCIRDLVSSLTAHEGSYEGPRRIRRIALVVDDFGIAVARQGRAKAPVFTTPEGRQFYDVTKGLTDAAGRALFAAEEAKLGKLEDARRVLKKIKKEWKKQTRYRYRGGHFPKDTAFRVFVGVR